MIVLEVIRALAIMGICLVIGWKAGRDYQLMISDRARWDRKHAINLERRPNGYER